MKKLSSADQRTQGNVIKRDSFVIFLFSCLTLFGVMQGFLSAAIPFIRDELGLSTLMVGWLFSSYALGRLGAGFVSSQLIRSQAGITAIRCVAIGLYLAMGLTWLSNTVVLNFVLAFCIGVFGGVLQALVQSQIATLDENSRSLAVGEGYIWASLGVCTFPAAMGCAVSIGLPWIFALALPLLSLVLMLSLNPERRVPKVSAQKDTSRITPIVVLFWALFFSINVLEWGVALWFPILFQETHKLTTAEAVSLMSIYFVSTLVGRIANVRLLKRKEADVLFVSYLCAAFIGISTVLFSTSMYFMVPALVLVGGSIGCFYPSNLSTALKYSPSEIRRVSAGSANCSGFAMLAVPPMLGFASTYNGVTTVIYILVLLPIIMIGFLIFVRKQIDAMKDKLALEAKLTG